MSRGRQAGAQPVAVAISPTPTDRATRLDERPTVGGSRTPTEAAKLGEPSELVVRGRRITLRYPRAADAPALYELASDPEVTRYFSWGPYRTPAEPTAWIATLPARRASGVALELAITDLEDRPLGIILLSEFAARDRRAVVGTWLGRAHWGTGVNHDAKALLARLAFGSLGIERLGAYADLRNGRSQAALERVGFSREGVLKAFHRHRDGACDVATYALLRNEWRVSRLARVTAVVTGAPPPAFVAGPPNRTGDALRPASCVPR